MYEARSAIDRELSSSSNKSKFFTSKKRKAKNTNDLSVKKGTGLSSSKGTNARTKAFWQIHDLK